MRHHRLATMAAAIGAAMLVASPALAVSWGPESRSTGGAAATCTVSTAQRAVHDDVATIVCDISDTGQDGDAVYVAWKQDGFATISLYNRDGSGTTVRRSDTRVNQDGSFGELRWRICRDRQAPISDSCSDWVRHRVP